MHTCTHKYIHIAYKLCKGSDFANNRSTEFIVRTAHPRPHLNTNRPDVPKPRIPGPLELEKASFKGFHRRLTNRSPLKGS